MGQFNDLTQEEHPPDMSGKRYIFERKCGPVVETIPAMDISFRRQFFTALVKSTRNAGAFHVLKRDVLVDSSIKSRILFRTGEIWQAFIFVYFNVPSEFWMMVDFVGRSSKRVII